MRKFLASLLVVACCVFFASLSQNESFSASHGTSGFPNLIDSWNVVNDVVENGSVTGFNVSIKFGSGCKSGSTNLCSVIGSGASAFTCGDASQMHWDNNSSLWNKGSITISHSGTKDGYDYFNATIKPTDWSSSAKDWTVHQRINFKFKRRAKVTLKSVAKDRYDKKELNSNVASKTVDYNASATVSGAISKSGYIFSHWGSSCPASGRNNTDVKCTVNPLTSDKTVAAYYGRPRYLTAYARDMVTNTALNDGKAIDGPKQGWYGEGTYTVTSANYNPSGYSWVKWDINGTTACANSTSRSCSMEKITNNIDVIAYYAKDVTLTARAVDKDTGDTLKNGVASSTVGYGQNATVDVSGYHPSGYTFSGWKGGDCSSESGASCTKNGMTADTTVVAYYSRNTFEGKTVASWGTNSSATAGYTHTDSASSSGSINDCSPTSGCKVTFNHYMKRTVGTGTTTYKVDRESNLVTSTRAISAGSIKGSTNTQSSGAEENVSTSKDLVLYPGMAVCERLTFKPYNVSGASEIYTRVCVSARGNAQPNDPGDTDTPEDPSGDFTGNNAFINIKVRNNSVSKWDKYQRSVYAKPPYDSNPGDTVSFRASYNPILQYTYYIVPSKMKIDGAGEVSGDGKTALGNLFNNNKGNTRRNWNNSFSVLLGNEKSGTRLKDYTYSAGSMSRQSPAPSTGDGTIRTIGINDVGTAVQETAKTNVNDTTKTTPSQVTFPNDAYNTGNVITADKYKTASVYVPYNFVTDTSITTPNDNNSDGSPKHPIYAGEDTTISYETVVDKKTNSYTTDGSDGQAYATKVKDARSALIVYYPSNVTKKGSGTVAGGVDDYNGLCSYFGYGGGESSYCSVPYFSEKQEQDPGIQKRSGSFNIQDLSAGSEICVASAVFPASSGDDNNWNNLNYSGTWKISESVCYTIAKRPSIQVWGGNTYSAGDIKTGLSVKRNLAGYTGYNAGAAQGTYVFGSWNELGIISGGSMSGFASGASLGYAFDNNGTLDPNPFGVNAPNADKNNHGGNSESDICKLSILTFANTCEDGAAYGDTGKAEVSESVGDDLSTLQDLINDLLVGASGGSVESVEGDLPVIDAASLNDAMYKSNGTITTHAISLGKGVIKAVLANDVVIGENIMVADEIYNTFEDVPKLVIYANNDIKINCGVTRIDAVLVAEKKVVTCNNLDGDDEVVKINDEENAHQLVVNGAVISGRLIANRTYGAATGANSIVPAEIINFDPTLYLWSSSESKSSDVNLNDNLEVTYIKELAPRY